MSGPSTRPLIVYDLDGTIIDSRRDLADSTNDVVLSYGGAALEIDAIAAMVGEGAKLLVQRALAAAGLDPDEPHALDRFRDAYDRRLVSTTLPYRGIEATLDAAGARATLAVLTNKPIAPTRRLLDAFDLSRRFRWTIGGDSPFGRKPDPAGLHHLMDQAAALPGSTLLIGDSMIDVLTARNAGVAVVVALYGFGEARGELVLEPHERRARTTAEVGAAVSAWLEQRES